MRRRNPVFLMQALLTLASVAVAGMLISSWRVVLYPSLLIVGVLIRLGLEDRPQSFRWSVPTGVVTILLALFGTLDLMGLATPSGEGTVLGWAPVTALYLFGVGSVFLLVGALFALMHAQPDRSGEQEAAPHRTQEGVDG